MRRSLDSASAVNAAHKRADAGPAVSAFQGTGASQTTGAPATARPKRSCTTKAQTTTKSLDLDRKSSTHTKPSSASTSSSARSRRVSKTSWTCIDSSSTNNNDALEKVEGLENELRKEEGKIEHESHTSMPENAIVRVPAANLPIVNVKMSDMCIQPRRLRFRSPWATSIVTITVTVLALLSLIVVAHSFVWRQQDAKGCRMSYMRPAFAKLDDFDTEHTRFASKYSTYLYREQMVDEDTKVKGVPVLFIPGNAGSYKQVRPIAAEAATYFHDVLQHEAATMAAGTRTLDFFTVDFNEEFTAFHGQAILDQAEYLNEAIAYILSLYHDPRRSERDSNLPDPTSVIILGHSMGGIVARTMLVMPNYQSNSINTIITMAAPHARPPVSFDAQIVDIYSHINDYWRQSYSQKWANDNPLWHVTLLSIAGGGLDTMVPSDYASLESLVPETHGFTVFTSTVPSVWTGMDHQAILWCDQFRKVVVKSLYAIVDVKRPTQTKPRAERIRLFQKWFLTGMESVAEKTLPQKRPSTLLTLEDNSNSILPQGEVLTLRQFGSTKRAKAYLMPLPPAGTPGGKRFTLLTDQKLDESGDTGTLEVLFCSVFPLNHGESADLFSMNMDLSGDSTGSTRLACKNAASDTILLPSSTRTSKLPFYLDDETVVPPFSYLQYDLDELHNQDKLFVTQFIAIVDKATETVPGFVIAEFSDNAEAKRIRHLGLRRLLAFGMQIRLPATRPVVMEVKIPALHSSLLAYDLKMTNQVCGEEGQLFTPLVRQYITQPYESKYFVNVKHASINLHGVAPYMPPPLHGHRVEDGISLQIWTDSTCNSTVVVSLKLDVLGSCGKLFIRYRTVLAAFPLLIVAIVMMKQFSIYDASGTFISFSDAMDNCLRGWLPVVAVILSSLSYYLASSVVAAQPTSVNLGDWRRNGTESPVNFKQNDLLIGSQDPFFWVLIPFLGVVCVGICVIMNYTVLLLIHIFCSIYAWAGTAFAPAWRSNDIRRRSASTIFYPSSTRRRVVTTAILLFLVSTFIPYQFAYLVACLVQIATCTRALRLARETQSGTNYNFYNYTHSILILMLWTIPAINLPILIVWIHNLAVQWLTPFSSHHNILSTMPFILLVETLTSGKMIPQLSSKLRVVTSLCFASIALYAALWGVTYAYHLHHLVTGAAAWLAFLHHFRGNSWKGWSLESLGFGIMTVSASSEKAGGDFGKGDKAP